MTFEEYFPVGDLPELDKAIRFVVGLAPAGLHRPYLVVPEAVNFAERAAPRPSWPASCAPASSPPKPSRSCSAAARCWQRRAACSSTPIRNKLAHTWRPGGNGNLLHRLMIAVAKRQMTRELAGKAVQA
jgi:hypothetical protein